MALGAAGPRVVRLLVASGLKLVVIGGALGLALAVAAARLLVGLLFEVDAVDPLTFLGASLVLGAAGSPRRLSAGPPRQPGPSGRRAPDRLTAGRSAKDSAPPFLPSACRPSGSTRLSWPQRLARYFLEHRRGLVLVRVGLFHEPVDGIAPSCSSAAHRARLAIAPVTTRVGLFHSAGAGTRIRPVASACRRLSQLCGSASGRSISASERLTGSGPTFRSSGLSVRFWRVANSTTVRSVR